MGEDITKAGSDVDKPGINPEEVPGPTEEAAGTGRLGPDLAQRWEQGVAQMEL